MTGLSVGTLTDLAILAADGAQITDRGEYLVITSPHNPGYYWGNFLQLRVPTASRTPQEWIATFQREVPGVAHVTFGLADAPEMTHWEPLGFRSDGEESLVTTSVPRTGPLPVGYTPRELVSDTDFAALAALKLRDNARTRAHRPDSYATFVERQVASWRRSVEAGDGRWFGADAPDATLAAALGIRVLADPWGGERVMARYQSVLTDAEHRRRGLAAHLLGLAGAWAGRKGAQEWVICTETTNAAGRVYRRAGFSPVAVAYGLERYPRG